MAHEFNIKNGFITSGQSYVYNNLTITGLTLSSVPTNDDTLTQILARDSSGLIKYRTASTLGGVTSVTAGSGLSGNSTTGAITLINTQVQGITGLTGGSNISITGSNNSYTISFTGTTGSNFTGGTVTGATNFTNGLTANTISATTYYNLPTDIRVTGGTYSNGSITFINNTGGTFSVTGLAIQGITGVTNGSGISTSLTNNNLTITNTQVQGITGLTGGSNVSVTGSNNSYTISFTGTTGSNFTGGTVTGATNFTNGLTANTISATTYYNLPTDVRVTGGTYSNGSATFTNNTGGTFSVSGFSTTTQGITGLTANNGLSALTTNNVTTIGFSGGSIVVATNFTNGLSANTISATTYQNLTAAGSDTQVQFNKSGAFSGNSSFYWDYTNLNLNIGTSNSILSSQYSHSVGPFNSTITGTTYSVIVGGNLNSVKKVNSSTTNSYNTIVGGTQNSIYDSSNFTNTQFNVILGGTTNQIYGNNNVSNAIIGGSTNSVRSLGWSAIIGGQGNDTSTYQNVVILGGTGLTATQDYTTYVQNLNINTPPTINNSLTQVLVRNVANGNISYRDASTLGGGGTFTGGTVTGATIFTGGLSANTFSATTYQGNVVTQIVNGGGLSLSPTGGTGVVTISVTTTATAAGNLFNYYNFI